MRQLRKVGLLCLTICMLACLAVGAIFTMSYAEPVKSGYGNVQLYKENDVKFEDRLWDIDYYAQNKEDWKITSGPYTSAYSTTNTLGYYMGNQAGTGITVEAYLIDGTYYYGDTTGGVNTITKVFAWVGFPNPTTHPEPEEGYPAIVCIHGGGGSAYSEWVAEWANLGYVAIAMDTEGHVPTTYKYEYSYNAQTNTVNYAIGQIDGSGKSVSALKSAGTDEANSILASTLGDGTTIADHVFAKSNATFTDTIYGTDLKTHWFYQATAAVIASNTFVRTFDCVNPEKVGITGISYGSYLTDLAIGYDSRYAAAVPIYGSINQQIGDKYFALKGQPSDSMNSVTAGIWDNPAILRGVETPTLYLMGNKDPHFDIRSAWSCANLQTNAKVIIRDEYPHGHTWAAKYSDTTNSFTTSHGETTTPKSILVDVTDFFDYHLKNDETISQIDIENQIFLLNGDYIFDVMLPDGESLQSASIYYTTESLLINDSNYIAGGSNSYGHYAMGTLSDSLVFDWDQKYINVSWTKISLWTMGGATGDGYTHSTKNYYTDALASDGYNLWRTQFVQYGGAYSYFATSPTYFYVEVVDSNGHHLVSDIVDLDASERPLYNTRIYDYYEHSQGNAVEFDWSADANGWAQEVRESIYDRAFGPLTINSDGSTSIPVDDEGKANQIVLGHNITATEIANGQTSKTGYLNHYGARAQAYSNGVTSIWTDAAAVVNYRAFNIYNDIEFYFNFSSEASYTMVTYTDGTYEVFDTVAEAEAIATAVANGASKQEVGGHCYFFSLFDNIETAMKCGQESFYNSSVNPNAPKICIAGSNCEIEDENNIYRGPLQGTLAINKGSLMKDSTLADKYRAIGATYNENCYLQELVDKWSDADIKSALKTNNPTTYTDEVLNNMDHDELVKALIPDTEQLWFTTKSAFQETTTSNCYDNWHKVTIRILDEGTYVYLNGNPITDPLTGEAYCHDLTRGDFKNGIAYLHYANSGNMQMNFKYEDLTFKNSYNKEMNMNQKDANGFSTYVQSAGTAYYLNGNTSAASIGKDFGSVENYYSGGVSTFKFNDTIVTSGVNTNGSVVRYTPFDISEDITFSYNFTSPIIFASGVQTNYFDYFFGLYDDLTTALTSSSSTTLAKLALEGSNYSGTNRSSEDRSAYNGKVKLISGDLDTFWSTTQTDIDNRTSWNLYPYYVVSGSASAIQGINEDNWDDYYINVRIRIGETSTSIYLNGDLYVTTSSITRDDFANGFAYLKLYTYVQNGEAKFNVKLNDNMQDAYTSYETYRNIKNYNDFPIDEYFYDASGNRFTYQMNDFGWSTLTSTSAASYNYLQDGYTAINVNDSVYAVNTQDSNGITTVDFVTDDAGRAAINFISFDIDEDIVFQFKVNDGDAEDSMGQMFFNISLFDNISHTFFSEDDMFNLDPDYSGYVSNPKKAAPVISFETVNGTGVSTDRAGYYSRLKLIKGPYSWTPINADTTANSTGIYSNKYNIGLGDDVKFNEVRIRVLDAYTLIYLNGELFGYFSDVNKSTISTGKLYLQVYAYNVTGWGATGTSRFALRTFAKNTITQKFDYEMDKYNSFATNIVDSDSYKNYTNIAGDNLTDMEFGLAEGSTFNVNSARLYFDRGYTVNYKGFDVTKDIVFKYSTSDPTYGVDENGFSARGNKESDADTVYNYSSYWYSFSFFNSAEIALKTGMEMWLTNNSANSIGGNALISLFGVNEPTGRVPAMDQNGSYSYYEGIYGTLKFNNISDSYTNAVTLSDDVTIEHLVKIKILDDCTEYYVDGILQFTNTYVKRSDFTYGKAYMAIGVCGTGYIDLEIDRETELYTYPTGNVYDYAVDANGWTTYKNTSQNILNNSLGLFNANLDPYKYATDSDYQALVNANPVEYGFVGDKFFSRNNGAEINAKGQSVINLGITQIDSDGNEHTDIMSWPTYVVQTGGFDVYKPIRLVYRLDSFNESGGTISDASAIFFALTETLDDAFNLKINAYNDSEGYAKIMLRTTNGLWFNDNSSTELGKDSFAGKIVGSEESLSSAFLYDNVDLENYCSATSDFASWQKDITVDINIGDEGTIITVNGVVVDLGYSSVKRSDFAYGKAYLNLCGFGSADIAIATSQEEVGYEDSFDVAIGDKFDISNTFELPIGYHSPEVSYTINGTHVASDFTIDGGIVKFGSDFVSPHHAGMDIPVRFTGIIDGERKVISETTFSLKTYLENALKEANAAITALADSTESQAYIVATAKRELIISLMNLSAGFQAYYGETKEENFANFGTEAAPVSVADRNVSAKIAAIKEAGEYVITNETTTSNVDTSVMRYRARNVGIGSSSTDYALRLAINAEYDISKLAVEYSFNKKLVKTITEFDNLVETITRDGITYNVYEIKVDGISAADYDKEVKFEYKYDGTSYGYHTSSVLDYADTKMAATNSDVVQTYAQAMYLYWLNVNNYIAAVTGSVNG